MNTPKEIYISEPTAGSVGIFGKGKGIYVEEPDEIDNIKYHHDDVVKELREALKEMISIVEIHTKHTGNNFAWAELDLAKEALEDQPNV